MVKSLFDADVAVGDAEGGRSVAVKRIKREEVTAAASQHSARQQFHNEINVLSSSVCTYLLTVYLLTREAPSIGSCRGRSATIAPSALPLLASTALDASATIAATLLLQRRHCCWCDVIALFVQTSTLLFNMDFGFKVLNFWFYFRRYDSRSRSELGRRDSPDAKSIPSMYSINVSEQKCLLSAPTEQHS